MEGRYDIAIIGTGPAGVSAAITAVIRNKKILLLGQKDLSDKMVKAHTIMNYPGLPHIPGAELGRAMQEHLASMDIRITEDRISAVYAMGDYYALQGAEQMYEATAVILASGVVTGKPLEGEEEFLGRGVSYCATCDAPLYRGKRAIVAGYSPKEEAEAAFLGEVCREVLYFPMYKETSGEPVISEVLEDTEGTVKVIRETVTAITSSPDGLEKTVHTAEGGTYVTDGVFILRDAVAPDKLIPGIGVRDGHVEVDRQMAANLPGCFACGDVTGTPYQYIKAAGEGNVAALSAAAYVDRVKRSGV